MQLRYSILSFIFCLYSAFWSFPKFLSGGPATGGQATDKIASKCWLSGTEPDGTLARQLKTYPTLRYQTWDTQIVQWKMPVSQNKDGWKGEHFRRPEWCFCDYQQFEFHEKEVLSCNFHNLTAPSFPFLLPHPSWGTKCRRKAKRGNNWLLKLEGTLVEDNWFRCSTCAFGGEHLQHKIFRMELEVMKCCNLWETTY